ncbi:MAG: 3-oxoacyl-[acyl-carrier-protein] synthase-1, partial [Flavobacteriales bacterium]
NSLKGMTGHCLAAAGAIETVAGILQLEEGMIFGNVNCESIHQEITDIIDVQKVPKETIAFAPKVLAKASFGFGDVNCCMIFKKYEE